MEAAVCFLNEGGLPVAFSSDVDAGSREENASKQKSKARF
jgi:hypothetical protein